MKIGKILLLFVGLVLMASFSAALQIKGAKDMTLSGGKLGNIPFLHHKHQVGLPDCSNCHNLFPQTQGAIQRLIAQKKLKKKQVMNQCRACHKQRAQSGEKAGPIKCKGCHKKK